MITHFPASVKTAFQKISVVFESLGAAHGSAIPCAAPQSLCLWSSRTLCAYLTPRRRIVFILALLRSLSALQVYNGYCRMSRLSVHISSFERSMYRDCPIGKKSLFAALNSCAVRHRLPCTRRGRRSPRRRSNIRPCPNALCNSRRCSGCLSLRLCADRRRFRLCSSNT